MVYFIRTRTDVNVPSLEILRKEFIPEDDQPEFPKIINDDTRIYPFSEKSFPGILSSMTATEAGKWAIQKCKSENWELSKDNIECCLSNLEMDF